MSNEPLKSLLSPSRQFKFTSFDLTLLNSEPVQKFQLLLAMLEGQEASKVECRLQMTEPKSLTLPIHQEFEACQMAYCPLIDVQLLKPLMGLIAVMNLVSKAECSILREFPRFKTKALQHLVSSFKRLPCRNSPKVADSGGS